MENCITCNELLKTKKIKYHENCLEFFCEKEKNTIVAYEVGIITKITRTDESIIKNFNCFEKE